MLLFQVVPKKKPKKPIKKVNGNIKGNTHWKKPKPTTRRGELYDGGQNNEPSPWTFP